VSSPTPAIPFFTFDGTEIQATPLDEEIGVPKKFRTDDGQVLESVDESRGIYRHPEYGALIYRNPPTSTH